MHPVLQGSDLGESIGTNSSSWSELWEEMSGTAEVVAEMWGLATCAGALKCSTQESGYFFPQTMGSHERFWSEG